MRLRSSIILWLPALAGSAFFWLPASAGNPLPTKQRPAESGSHGIFVESAAETSLDFKHVNGATGKYYLPEQMGAGVALFDYDNDGDLDVFLVQDGPLNASPPGSSPNYPTSHLFRNDLARG